MKKTNRKFELKNNYFLAGPFALVAFFLTDVIAGYNFPGYDWVAKSRADLTALNSYSFVYGIAFSVIYCGLFCFAIYCLYRYFKGRKTEKNLGRGLRLYMIASVVLAIGTTIFMIPEVGTFENAKEHAFIGTTTEVVDSDSDVTETQEVFSMDATMDNLANLGEAIAHPLTIARLLSIAVGVIMCIVAFIFIVIAGFKKSKNLLFSAAAVFCLVLVLYSFFATLLMDSTTLGLNTRFGAYAITFFACFLSSYVYVTNIEE